MNMNRRTVVGSLVALAIVLFFAWAIKGVLDHNKRIRTEQLTLQTEADRVIANVGRSIAGADGVASDAEKVRFLRWLGVGEIVQSGQVIILTAHKHDNSDSPLKSPLTLDVWVGVEVSQHKTGPSYSPSKLLGTFPKERLEQFAAENIEWVE